MNNGALYVALVCFGMAIGISIESIAVAYCAKCQTRKCARKDDAEDDDDTDV